MRASNKRDDRIEQSRWIRSTLTVAFAVILICCIRCDAESNVDVDLTRAEPGVVNRITDVESFEVGPARAVRQ